MVVDFILANWIKVVYLLEVMQFRLIQSNVDKAASTEIGAALMSLAPQMVVG